MKKPELSVVMPVYNEEKYIEKTLQSIYNQDYPLDKIEIIIAEGNSTDRTIELIDNFKKNNPLLNMKVISNPKKNTSIGRNLCLNASSGRFIMNFSGHAVAQKNLLKTLVKKLNNSSENVVGVGCSNLSPKYGNFTSKVLSVIFSSIMGGSSVFEQNMKFKKDRFVKSMAFTLYRKKPLQKIGGFDSSLWCGQDGELNLRLRKKGYKILYTPETYVHLHKRDAIGKFFRQMYQYGIARVKIMKKHKDTLRLNYLLPSIFTILSIITIILSFFNNFFLLLLIFLATLFIIFSFIFALLAQGNFFIILASPIFYFILYFAYGLGILRGLLPHKF